MASTTTKNILVTGGSRGIGRATALLAGEHRWSVAINYLGNANAAKETVDMVKAAGGEAVAVQGDVAREEDVLAMFDAAEQAFGALDAVVVNAGIVAPGMPLKDMTAERIQKVVDTNVVGALLCAREAVRRLSKSASANRSIVLISSAAARLGAPSEYVDYAASKGAIDTLAIGLSKELAGQGIRVNAVRPGLIETDIHASGGEPDRAKRLAPHVPLARPGSAREVAEGILWLMEDRSSYTTGAILDIAGGR